LRSRIDRDGKTARQVLRAQESMGFAENEVERSWW
jgi:hypothetical protein